METLNGINRRSKAYKLYLELANGADFVRPIWTIGSGRYIHYSDHLAELETILSKLSIPYRVTNDAPKGGKYGTKVALL